MSRNTITNKGTILGIIALFIALTLTPVISGDAKENGGIPGGEEITSSIQFIWIDDDGSLSDNNTDGVIPMIPPLGPDQPIPLQFSVQNESGKYLGEGNLSEDKKNITISGDALFLENGGLTLDNFPSNMIGYDTNEHKWYVNVTPRMAVEGGKIQINIDWGLNGAHEENISIGGTDLNGTVVDISPTRFPFGTDVVLTVTLKGPYGMPLTGCNVSLYWIKADGALGAKINTTNISDTPVGNTYSFIFDTLQQSQWQLNESNGWNAIEELRNIAAYVNVTNVGYGYAKATMTASSDLKVEIEPSTVLVGEIISIMYFNTTVVDSNGNVIGYPSDSGLKVRIYSESGVDVTGIIGNLDQTDLDGSANKSVTTVSFSIPGIYTVHAYNNTHQSIEENNATLTITGDTTPPNIRIIKPGRALYVFNKRLIDLPSPLIIAGIDIKVEASDSGSGIKVVKFYIDGELRENDTSKPYLWTWNERAILAHHIKVEAYDYNDNIAKDSITVFTLNLFPEIKFGVLKGKIEHNYSWFGMQGVPLVNVTAESITGNYTKHTFTKMIPFINLGNFTLRIPTGPYNITVEKEGFITQQREVEVVLGDNEFLYFEFKKP